MEPDVVVVCAVDAAHGVRVMLGWMIVSPKKLVANGGLPDQLSLLFTLQTPRPKHLQGTQANLTNNPRVQDRLPCVKNRLEKR